MAAARAPRGFLPGSEDGAAQGSPLGKSQSPKGDGEAGKMNAKEISLAVLIIVVTLCSFPGRSYGKGAISESRDPALPPAFGEGSDSPGPLHDAQATAKAQSFSAESFFIRPNGGNAVQCTGKADAPYPGSGTGQPCAWDHPFRALPPGGAPRISGGDTLYVSSGAYMMGYGAPGTEICEADAAWDCHMPPVPSGPDASHPTRILGAGWNLGCPSPPELWGTERANLVVNLTDSSNVEIACLEITDHSGCVEFHSGALACERDSPPFGPWASVGLYAEDSSNVRLRHLNIHGLGSTGVLAGRLRDWTVEEVRIAANGWAGWDGDIEKEDANAGEMTFRRWIVEWNGCGETYPGEAPAGCWAQSAGGYGDGVGTGATGGDWLIEDSRFLHNTSDGLDLLYHTLGGKITLNRVWAEGNAGNQVKVTGETSITNSVLVGNCAFFEGQAFTHHVDPCRALGNTLEAVYTGGEKLSIVHSTLYAQGDGLIGGGPREGFECNGRELITARNSIFLGDTEFTGDGTDISFLFYQENCGTLRLDSDYNIIFRSKNVTCTQEEIYVRSGPHDLCRDPELSGPFAGSSYGMVPAGGSPAIDAASGLDAPAQDILGKPRPRGEAPDIGAYEYSDASAGPYPGVKVNGQDALTVVPSGTLLSVTFSVSPWSSAGAQGELWVGVYTPFGPPLDWLTFTATGGWHSGLVPLGQAAPQGMWPREILLFPLPEGAYVFFCAFDDMADGAPAPTSLDYVPVQVVPWIP